MKINLYRMHLGSAIAIVHLCITTLLIAVIHCQFPILCINSNTAEVLLVVLRFPLILLEANPRDYWSPPVQGTALIAFVSVVSAYLWGYSIAIVSKATRSLIKRRTHRAHNKLQQATHQNSRLRSVVVNKKMNGITLRPVRDEDSEFVFRTKKVALGPYITETYGWDEVEQRALHARRFRSADIQIVVLKEQLLVC